MKIRYALPGLLLLANPLLAEPTLQLYELKSVPASEIQAFLQPLAGDQARLTSRGRHLAVHADEALQIQLGTLIEALDRPARRLRLRFHVGTRAPGQKASHYSTRDKRDLSLEIATRDGRPARVETGVDFPVLEYSETTAGGYLEIQAGTEYRQAHSHFHVLPLLDGDQVSLFVTAQREQLSGRISAAIEHDSQQALVTGPLGAWIPVSRRNVAEPLPHYHATRSSHQQQIWVRVDPLD